MKYALYVTQKGEGCGYTIACGERLVYLTSSNKEDAIKEASEVIQGSFYYPEQRLKSAILYEMTEEGLELDTRRIYEDLRFKEEEQKEVQQRKRDEEEFERLKKRLGK
jgi:hypothetical protein